MDKKRIQALHQNNQGGQWMPAPTLLYDFLTSPNPIIGGGTTTTVIDADGTYVNSAGLITQKTTNVWPLDYDPATGVEGTELVSNPTLATNANGWTATGAATIVSSGGRGLGIINNAFEAIGTTVTGLTVGQRYRFSGTVERGTIASITATLTGIADVVAITGSGPQNFTYDFVAIAASQFVGFYSGGTGTFFIDVTSVKLVTSTPLGRPIWEARTNLLTYSSDLSNAIWLPVGAKNVSVNTTISPDGTLNADTVSDVSAVAFEGISQGFVIPNDSSPYVYSAYIQKTVAAANSLGWNILMAGGTGPGVFPRLNTNNGNAPGFQTVDSGDYWRIAASLDNDSSGNVVYTTSMFPATGVNSGVNPGADDAAAVGSQVPWGNQVEVGAFPTPYIPTNGAAVTRSADACSIAFDPGSQGTIVAEWIIGANAPLNQVVWSMNDGTTNNDIFIYLSSGGLDYRLAIFAGGVLQCDISSGVAMVQNAVTRAAIGLAANNCAISVNGSVPATDNTVTIPTVTTLQLGFGPFVTASYLNGWERKLAFYPTAYSGYYLQQLSRV